MQLGAFTPISIGNAILECVTFLRLLEITLNGFFFQSVGIETQQKMQKQKNNDVWLADVNTAVFSPRLWDVMKQKDRWSVDVAGDGG